MTDKPQEETMKERISGLLRKGYTRSQLITDFNFAERTVDSAIKAYREQGGDDHGSITNDNKAAYHQNSSSAAPNALPVKIGPKDMIPPEAALEHIRLQDGDYKKGFTDGMTVLILAARYNQLLAGAQAEATESQLKILREVKSSTDEVAYVAAQQAAEGVARYFEETKPWLTAGSNPVASMMVNLMQPYLQQVMGNLMGIFASRQHGAQPNTQPPIAGSQPGIPGTPTNFPGFVEERRKEEE
jgi:hypothetical protein